MKQYIGKRLADRIANEDEQLRLRQLIAEKDARIAEMERAAVAHVRQVDNMQATIDEMLASDFGKMSERIAELEEMVESCELMGYSWEVDHWEDLGDM